MQDGFAFGVMFLGDVLRVSLEPFGGVAALLLVARFVFVGRFVVATRFRRRHVFTSADLGDTRDGGDVATGGDDEPLLLGQSKGAGAATRPGTDSTGVQDAHAVIVTSPLSG